MLMLGKNTITRFVTAAACMSCVAQDAATDGLATEQRSQTGTAITIIFDSSGSMRKNGKMGQAKRAFGWWLEGMSEANRFSLIHFAMGGTVEVPISDGERDRVREAVAGLRARGKTPIVKCLQLTSREIAERRQNFSPYERHVVVLLTDGAETIDPGGNGAVQEAVRQLRDQMVEVVGIGFHGEGDYLSGVATQYFRASDEGSLKEGLQKVVAELDDQAEVEMTPEEKSAMESSDFPVPPAPSESSAVSNKKTSAQVAPPPQRSPVKKDGGSSSSRVFFGIGVVACYCVVSFIKKKFS